MYNIYYGFKHKPFQLLPNPDYLYASPQYKNALTLIEGGLVENMGPMLLTGEAGTGKTTLIRCMLTRFCSDKQAAVIFSTNVSSEELLSLILLAFKVNGADGGKALKFDLLQNFLIKESKEGRQVLLIVDEAQNLSQEALEDIQRLSNLQREAALLISIMLVGQPELKIKLDNPRLASLVERMVVKYDLTPLTQQETDEYIAYRLQKAGGKPDLFESEALDRIYRYSGGIPRSINVVCSAALVYGFRYGLDSIGIPLIEEVIQNRKSLYLPRETDLPSGTELPNESDDETRGSRAEPAAGSDDEIQQRLENVEDAVRVLQTLMKKLTTELTRKTESINDDLIQETKELISAGSEHRDSMMNEYTRLKEKFEPPERPQTAAGKKIGRILMPATGEPNHLVKGKRRRRMSA